MIKIDHGVELSRVPQSPPLLTYVYRYHDKQGYHVLLFTASEKPEIGDFIDNGVLVKRVGLQINPDTSKWPQYREPDESY